MHILSSVTPSFQFDPMAFIENMKHMGVGMLVIFAVIGLIILTTMLINWLFSDPKQK
ncbi:MAG: hypothetical protein IKA47_06915 [Oscillospiraceae bacterium]|nr:hypothetical protein [Oscillospiraceae bacterium]